jgi:hypothetical protein
MNLVLAVVLIVVSSLAILGGVGWWIDTDADRREDIVRQVRVP